MNGRIHNEKVKQAHAHARSLIPESILNRLQCSVYIGVDPYFSGLSRGKGQEVDGLYYSYKDLAHVAYPYHHMHLPANKRDVKLYLPRNKNYWWDTWRGPKTVVHEYGHVLGYKLEFDHPHFKPVSQYAKTNFREAFAEAFSYWVMGYDYCLDEEIRVFFETLENSWT